MYVLHIFLNFFLQKDWYYCHILTFWGLWCCQGKSVMQSYFMWNWIRSCTESVMLMWLIRKLWKESLEFMKITVYKCQRSELQMPHRKMLGQHCVPLFLRGLKIVMLNCDVMSHVPLKNSTVPYSIKSIQNS